MKVSTSAKVAGGLAVTLLLLLAVAASAFLSARRTARSAGLVERTLDVESDLSDLEKTMVGAESSTRGFLLTGDEDYLDSYRAAPALVRDEIIGLRRKTADDPVQQRHLAALEPLVAAKFARMDRTVELRRRGGSEAAAAEVSSGIGRRLMTGIRTHLRAMSLREERVAADRNEGQIAGARRTQRFILLTAAIAAAFVSVAGFVIERDLLGRRRAEEALRNLSMIDELTGVYNRRGFLIHAEDRVKLASRLRNGQVLVFADVDGLKSINDAFGHSAGDEALTAAAALLKSSFRESDVVARLGGDEFVVLALMERSENAEIPVRALREALAAWNGRDDRPFRLSMSIGVTPIAAGARLEELLAIADRNMYAAKQDRRRSTDSGEIAVRD